MREFAKIFIDNIVIFSRIKKKYLKHLKTIFKRLFSYDVTLNSIKVFLNFSFLILLNQVINALRLIIAKKKLIAIIPLIFSRILSAFEVYLKLTKWMRNYISYYAQIVEPLQNQKTIFLKNEFIKNNFKKTFFKRTSIDQSINAKYQSYKYLQIRFSKSSLLIHFETMKSTFINVDVSKKRNFEIMIFHVQNDFEENDIIIIKNEIQFIMFFSKILIDAETRYWLIELKMVGVVWIVKKIRHMIESCRKSLMIIFIDYAVTADLIKQISLTTFNTNKLNLRFVRTFQFLSALFIKIRIKSEKLHVIFDVLFRFKTNSDSNVENLLSNWKSKETVVLKNLNDVKRLFAHVRQLRHRSLRNI